VIRSLNPFKENVPSFALRATVKTTERWDIFLIGISIRKMSHRSYALTANGEKHASTVPRSDRANRKRN